MNRYPYFVLAIILLGLASLQICSAALTSNYHLDCTFQESYDWGGYSNYQQYQGYSDVSTDSNIGYIASANWDSNSKQCTDGTTHCDVSEKKGVIDNCDSGYCDHTFTFSGYHTPPPVYSVDPVTVNSRRLDDYSWFDAWMFGAAGPSFCNSGAYWADFRGGTATSSTECDGNVQVTTVDTSADSYAPPGTIVSGHSVTRTGVCPSCGDGIVQTANGEQCDLGSDPVTGNGAPGVSCSATCQSQDSCTGMPDGSRPDGCKQDRSGGCSYQMCEASSCKTKTLPDGSDCGYGSCTSGVCTPASSTCGNGIVEPGEDCDNGGGNGQAGNPCGADCHFASFCGNGVVDAGEQCDLGAQNGVPGSGCTSDCQYESGTCGDGVVTPPEQCDNGANNGAPGSPCDANCQWVCGDNLVETGADYCWGNGLTPNGDACIVSPAGASEQCDNGANNGPGEVCDANCQLPTCGNGIVDAGEECDPGLTCSDGFWCTDFRTCLARNPSGDKDCKARSNPYCTDQCKYADQCLTPVTGAPNVCSAPVTKWVQVDFSNLQPFCVQHLMVYPYIGSIVVPINSVSGDIKYSFSSSYQFRNPAASAIQFNNPNCDGDSTGGGSLYYDVLYRLHTDGTNTYADILVSGASGLSSGITIFKQNNLLVGSSPAYCGSPVVFSSNAALGNSLNPSDGPGGSVTVTPYCQGTGVWCNSQKSECDSWARGKGIGVGNGDGTCQDYDCDTSIHQCFEKDVPKGQNKACTPSNPVACVDPKCNGNGKCGVLNSAYQQFSKGSSSLSCSVWASRYKAGWFDPNSIYDIINGKSKSCCGMPTCPIAQTIVAYPQGQASGVTKTTTYACKGPMGTAACINNAPAGTALSLINVLTPNPDRCTNIGQSNKMCCQYVTYAGTPPPGQTGGGTIGGWGGIILPIFYHSTCVNHKSCVVVFGFGSNECYSDSNCTGTPTHNICENEACVSIAGDGNNVCNLGDNTPCLFNFTCLGSTCVQVDRALTSDDKPCLGLSDFITCNTPEITHSACSSDHKCVKVLGAGIDLCTSDLNCTNITAMPCLDSQTIMSLLTQNNSLGALWNVSSYQYKVCYPAVFGSTYNGNNPHDCTGSNVVLNISSSIGAFGENISLGNYKTPVCYGNLTCVFRKNSCNSDEKAVVSLDKQTGANFSAYDYPPFVYKICCGAGNSTIQPQPSAGAIKDVYWVNNIRAVINVSYVNSTVWLLANSNFNAGTIVNFTIYKNGIIVKGISGSVNSGIALASWKITDSDLLVGGSSNRFYFNASSVDSSNVSSDLAVASWVEPIRIIYGCVSYDNNASECNSDAYGYLRRDYNYDRECMTGKSSVGGCDVSCYCQFNIAEDSCSFVKSVAGASCLNSFLCEIRVNRTSLSQCVAGRQMLNFIGLRSNISAGITLPPYRDDPLCKDRNLTGYCAYGESLLPFFDWGNLIAAVVLIVVIYLIYWLSNRKRRAKKKRRRA